MIRVFPAYDTHDIQVRLFRKAVASQWSADDVDWDAPLGLDGRQAVALTRIMSPVYLGEQSAMYGAAAVIPQLATAGETAAQLYLSTFLLDEARHFDVLTAFYRHLEHHPVGLREVPEMMRYHHRLRQGDRIDWLWGILISDLFARQFYQVFSRVQPAALFGRMSARVLVDESRHQAFAHAYLKGAMPGLPPERRRALLAMRDELLRTMQAMHARLRDDAELLGFEGRAFFGELAAQIEAHARSIGIGTHVDGDPGGPPADRSAWVRLMRARREQADSGDGVAWPPALHEASSGEAAPAVGAVGGAARTPASPPGGARGHAAWTGGASGLEDRSGEVRSPARLGSEGRRYFLFSGLAAGCGDCVMALLCRSRLVRSGCRG